MSNDVIHALILALGSAPPVGAAQRRARCERGRVRGSSSVGVVPSPARRPVCTKRVAAATIPTLIPARIDRMPWSPFHTRMVVALGVAWILDGLEITVASSVAGVLSTPEALNLSSTAVGTVATVYLAGEVFGALVFGRLSDALGRRRLFLITLAIYMFGSGLTALTAGSSIGWVLFLYATRFIAGMGIGGEYAAINSAIDELMPARYRGRIGASRPSDHTPR